MYYFLLGFIYIVGAEWIRHTLTTVCFVLAADAVVISVTNEIGQNTEAV